jgi:hypothetical protein
MHLPAAWPWAHAAYSLARRARHCWPDRPPVRQDRPETARGDQPAPPGQLDMHRPVNTTRIHCAASRAGATVDTGLAFAARAARRTCFATLVGEHHPAVGVDVDDPTRSSALRPAKPIQRAQGAEQLVEEPVHRATFRRLARLAAPAQCHQMSGSSTNSHHRLGVMTLGGSTSAT